MSSPVPTVGRVVHYISHGTPVRADGTQAYEPEHRAAIVTEVDPRNPTRVGLAVLNPAGMFFHPLANGGSEQDDPPPPADRGTGPNEAETSRGARCPAVNAGPSAGRWTTSGSG